MPADVTTARIVYAPDLGRAGAVTRNLAERDSSSAVNAIGVDAGVTVQPSGTSSATLVCAAPLVLLVTDTNTSRDTGLGAGPVCAGKMASV